MDCRSNIAGHLCEYTMGRQRISGGQWGQLSTALVFLLVLANLGLSTWDPVERTCNMLLARGVVVGNKLYIDGGEITDQGNYKDGLDKPYPISTMTRWQSECPSTNLPECPFLCNLGLLY